MEWFRIEERIVSKLWYSNWIIANLSIVYGVSIGQFGFLDDWYIIWTYKTFGAEKFVDFLGRPTTFSNRISNYYPIIRFSAFLANICNFTKWLAAISLWALLSSCCPRGTLLHMQ